MKVYALREIKSKRYLSMSTTSNEEYDDCNQCTVALEVWDHPCYWTTVDLDLAQYIRGSIVEWFNSSEDCPCHDYKPEELEIVELGSEEVIEGKVLPFDYEVFGVTYPWNKTTRSYSFHKYKKYLEK